MLQIKNDLSAAWRFVGVALLALLLPGLALAKFPSQPITLVVGYPPGGSNDLIARIYAPKVSQILGVPVIVVNKPGADATIGTAFTVNAKPDGYTITLGSTSALSISPHMMAHLPYDLAKDLAPITTVASSTAILAVNPKDKTKNLADLVALSKTRPVTLASAGVGSISHLNIELLKMHTKGNFVHVPYRGAVPAETDVVGGQIDGIIMDYSPLSGMIKNGRMVGVAASTTVASIPESKEIVAAWYAVEAPAQTPSDVMNTLHAAFTKAAHAPDLVAQLESLNMKPMTQPSVQQAASFIRDDSARWARVIKDADIPAQ